jgi:anti-anti-sigma factor
LELRAGSLLGVPVLAVSGDLDHSNALDLEKAAGNALQGDNERLLVDLSSCRYIDSGGLAVFLYLVRRLREQGWLGVIGADEDLHRLFEIVGLTQEPAFREVASREEAAELVRG